MITKTEVLLMTTLEAEIGSFEFKANLGYMVIPYCKQKKTTPHTTECLLMGSGHRGHSNRSKSVGIYRSKSVGIQVQIS